MKVYLYIKPPLYSFHLNAIDIKVIVPTIKTFSFVLDIVIKNRLWQAFSMWDINRSKAYFR